VSKGIAELDAMIRRLRELPESLVKDAAPEIARVVEQEIKRTIAAGTTPEGEPWERTLDGRKPLQHAASAVFVGAVGTTIFVRLTGPEARHHLGQARGGKVRRVIPETIPPAMAAKMVDVIGERFAEAMRNG
jgi:hypothetical protein